jgi:hypothetical protein
MAASLVSSSRSILQREVILTQKPEIVACLTVDSIAQ